SHSRLSLRVATSSLGLRLLAGHLLSPVCAASRIELLRLSLSTDCVHLRAFYHLLRRCSKMVLGGAFLRYRDRLSRRYFDWAHHARPFLRSHRVPRARRLRDGRRRHRLFRGDEVPRHAPFLVELVCRNLQGSLPETERPLYLRRRHPNAHHESDSRLSHPPYLAQAALFSANRDAA